MDPQAPNPLLQFVPLIVIFAIFYFLVIQPQKKKQNELKQRIAALKKNDRIVTVGGIHGTVVLVKEHTLVIRVDDNTRIEIDKDAVARVKE